LAQKPDFKPTIPWNKRSTNGPQLGSNGISKVSFIYLYVYIFEDTLKFCFAHFNCIKIWRSDDHRIFGSYK
jgi:hypothetical protein